MFEERNGDFSIMEQPMISLTSAIQILQSGIVGKKKMEKVGCTVEMELECIYRNIQNKVDFGDGDHDDYDCISGQSYQSQSFPKPTFKIV